MDPYIDNKESFCYLFPQSNISPRVREFIPGVFCTVLITSTFCFKLVGCDKILSGCNSGCSMVAVRRSASSRKGFTVD